MFQYIFLLLEYRPNDCCLIIFNDLTPQSTRLIVTMENTLNMIKTNLIADRENLIKVACTI
jgi:hypothetical protein